MIRKRLVQFSLLALIFGAMTSVSSAVPIVANGDFEILDAAQNSNPPAWSESTGALETYSGNNFLNGWTVSPSASTFLIQGNAGFATTFGYPLPPSGSQALYFGASGGLADSISQTVSTTPGATYQLSYFEGGFKGTGSLVETVTGVGIDHTQSFSAMTPWSSQVFTFVASANSEVLTFSGFNTLGLMGLDQVTLTQISAPEVDPDSFVSPLVFCCLALLLLSDRLSTSRTGTLPTTR